MIDVFISQVVSRPKAREHLLKVLRQESLSPEAKYQKLVEFIESVEKVAQAGWLCDEECWQEETFAGPQAVAPALRGLPNPSLLQKDFWDWQVALQDTENSIRRALERIRRCRHRDGGYGYHIEHSSVWGTCRAMSALVKSQGRFDLEWDQEELIQGCVAWLRSRQMQWAMLVSRPSEDRGQYETALAVCALIEVGPRYLGDLAYAVERTVLALAEAQNIDGGWDATLWGGASQGQHGIWSEVGATSLAVQAIAAWGLWEKKGGHASELRQRLIAAMQWLRAAQNNDGSWNAGSCSPDSVRPRERPSATKTCDAIKGILVSSQFLNGDASESIEECVTKGAHWVLGEERLLTNSQGAVMGWGFSDPHLADLDSTCLVLETLVHVKTVSPIHLWANVRSLMAAQHREPGSVDDGKWAFGDTFRICSGLIEFHRKLKDLSVQSRPVRHRTGSSETDMPHAPPGQEEDVAGEEMSLEMLPNRPR